MGGSKQILVPKSLQPMLDSSSEHKHHGLEGASNEVAQVDGVSIPMSEQPTPNKFSLDLFELGERLGPEGEEDQDEDAWPYERSYLAHERDSGSEYALKIINKGRLRITQPVSMFREQAQREIDIPANLKHPNVLKLYGQFEDETNTYVVLELPEKMDLYKRLCAETRFQEEKAARYIAQVAAGLHYLHGKHIIHRDIKPEHLRLGIDGQVKISGFKNTICGTLEYMPPEMLKPSEILGCYYVAPGLQTPDNVSYTNKIDLWSLGVLAYEFLVGATPWGDESTFEVQKKISKGEVNIPSFLLVLDPDQRLSLEDVQKHPWIIKDHPKEQATTAEE